MKDQDGSRAGALTQADPPEPSALWSNYLVLGLGLWLLSSAASFGYDDPRMRLSELLSGAALLALASASLAWKVSWPKWCAAAIGLWLTLAPLALWSKDAAGYANGNLVGSLVILAAIVIPSLWRREDSSSDIPPGWSYNPSAWSQRLPIIGLAFTGFLLAKYLAAYQLGHIASVWDPFFGDGTRSILESDVSKAFPVSDAGLGAWSYLLDALSGAYGSARRWRTQPWVVVLFGLMVIPPGVVSIVLVMLQPIAVGAWCTICLATAVVMLLMIPPAIDEVVATVQFLIERKRQGYSLWSTFWHGGEQVGPLGTAEHEPKDRGEKGLVPWTLVLSATLGAWLMVSPAVFSSQGLAADSHYLMGALIITFAVIAMASVGRPARFINLLLGFLLVASVWFLPGGALSFRLNAVVCGLAVMGLSLPLGRVRDRFGSYDRIIRWTPFRRRGDFDERSGSRAA